MTAEGTGPGQLTTSPSEGGLSADATWVCLSHNPWEQAPAWKGEMSVWVVSSSSPSFRNPRPVQNGVVHRDNPPPAQPDPHLPAAAALDRQLTPREKKTKVVYFHCFHLSTVV